MAPLSQRLGEARARAGSPRVVVTDIERDLGSIFTVDTLARLRKLAPRTRFVWLMGADNLRQISRWRRWRRIFHLVPIAVFDRPGQAYRALAGRAAKRFRRARRHGRRASTLAKASPPAWTFLHIRTHPASGTEIRARRAGLPPAKALSPKRR